MMDERYEVFDTLGKGVFSTVLRARDTAHKTALGKHPEVAVKVGLIPWHSDSERLPCPFEQAAAC